MNRRRGAALLIVLGLGLTSAALPAADSARPFVAGSYREILAAQRDRPLIVAFWSLACAHCLEELPILRTWAERHPQARLVLVSTDAAENSAAVTAMLRTHRLARHESWVFADDLPERLRYEIDPRWRGELPRSTLRGRDGTVYTIVGKLDPVELDRWLIGRRRDP